MTSAQGEKFPRVEALSGLEVSLAAVAGRFSPFCCSRFLSGNKRRHHLLLNRLLLLISADSRVSTVRELITARPFIVLKKAPQCLFFLPLSKRPGSCERVGLSERRNEEASGALAAEIIGAASSARAGVLLWRDACKDEG